MMNKMTNDNIVEEALSQLNMKYRSVTYKKSLIYFVTTENGTIFDISIGENGKIRFWKFIGKTYLYIIPKPIQKINCFFIKFILKKD